MHTYIDKILPNYSNAPSVVSQILRDELSFSFGRNLYLRCRMDVATDTVQPMGPQLVIHELLTIDTLNEKIGIWIPVTSAIRRTLNTTHGSVYGDVVGQGTEVG